ncbi:RHS repeat protein [Acinetobacter gerneri]|uniref:RHS repeat protein n=1 Tax=Acinetobacter gerneri TaxID=202952 RepID=UPI003213D5C2
MGNHPKSNNGVTQQGYIWFYTDLTGAAYFKKASSIASTALVAKWDYTLFSFDRDGYSESKSYRVNNSTYSGQDVNQYQVKYGYSLNSNNNEQTTTVTTSDSKTGLNKSSSYIMYSFARGDSENIFHGILKQIKTDNREENYTWQTLPTIIGKKPKVTKEDQYTGEENVYLLRLAGKTINHNGTYSTTYSDFDLYGNAKNIMSTGMIGSNSITLPYSIIEYYNSDPKNSAVNDGSLPWLVGLPRSKKTEGYTTQVTNYDSQGAIINDQKEGRFTQYKYATTTFSSCLGALADFSWSKFTGCISNYMNDRHNGLVIEKNIGNGKEITNYSAYYKGVPTQIKNANGGLETNKVDDFGNITEHKDADNVVSKNQYDDAGRLIVDTPIVGLAYTTINYDGLNITKTLNNGGTSLTRLEKYNGDGLLIYSEDRAANKTIVNSTVYDAFGNVTFKANPTTGGMNGGISTTYDIFNRPLTVNDNGVSINYCYQNCDGRTGAITLTTDAYGTTESDYLAFGDFSTGLKTTTLRKGSDGEQFKTATEYNLALLKPFSAISGNSSQSYSYNPNGTLATEKDNSIPGQKSYGYDDTGRIRTITHQDGSSESINYYPFNNLIASRSWRGMTTSYGYTNAGRLISSNNGATSQSYVPDAFGRVKSITQNINSDNLNKAYTTTYNYNNLNQVINIVYPSGKVANFSNQNAFGEISAIPNVIQSLNYNALHQLTTVQANSNVVWSYSYSNNGLLTNVTASGLNPCTLNISYKYDALNRINTLIDSCGTTYKATITRYGTGLMKQVELNQARYSYNYNNDDITNVNIVSKSQTVQPATYVYNYVNGTSRLGNVSGSRYGFSYDAMGNVINDGIRALSYDAYYRISKNGNETYIYNSEGLRVRAIRDDGITDYVYDGGGTLIYDINHKSGYNRTYIYVAGKLLATLENFPDTNSKGYDNLTDFEAAEFGVNSLLESYQDSDDDGLPDYIERLIGSDPNNPDTDGDGYKDGYEYKTLGPKGVLDANIHPNEPDPDEEMAAWLPPILDMILDDDN